MGAATSSVRDPRCRNIYVILSHQTYGSGDLIGQRSKTSHGELEPFCACLVHRFPFHGGGHDAAHPLTQRLESKGSSGVNMIPDVAVEM